MATNDPLKVKKVPKALASTARKLNQLVRLIRTIEGKGGVKVFVSDGKIVIDASGVTGTGGGSSYTEGAAVDVVGSDGKLNKAVKHSTWVAPTTYPTNVRCGDTAAPMAEMTQSGVTVYGTGPTRSATLGPGNFFASRTGYTAGLSCDPSDGLYLSNGSVSLFAQISAITQNMTIREIDVCDSGVAKKMLVLASAPY